LIDFARIAAKRGETARQKLWNEKAEGFRLSLEGNAWDGNWYRRGFFDDGSTLGAASDSECRIDSIAQSWAVLSGAADPVRARQGMLSAESYLVRRDAGLILLFTPPFDKSDRDPGYVKGYLPGVRENGGQYTHAALWMVAAFAALGEGDKASELFSLLNPINHASNRTGVYRYKVEPYVVAADVYAEYPHSGRGGWTWYTGSSGWMLRVNLEWILGFKIIEGRLHLKPCIPREWRKFDIRFTKGTSTFNLEVVNPNGKNSGIVQCEVDGIVIHPVPESLAITEDGRNHHFKFILG
jgi:cyclic beta-1,2-glucan synthetase